MLPAWATVLIALGGSLIGAAAGVIGSYFTLRGSRLGIEHQEREAWRSIQITAAEGLLESSENVLRLAIRIADAALEGKDIDELPNIDEEVDEVTGAITNRLARVALTFGPVSHTSEAAKELSLKMVEYLQGAPDATSLEEVQSLGSAVGVAQGKFAIAAHGEIRPKSI